jgi:archaeal cell division control protein 6
MGIFKDKTVLSIQYTPEKPLGREEEIRHMAMAFKPYTAGSHPRNILIYGMAGTGKSTVTEYVLRKYLIALKEQDVSNVRVVSLTVDNWPASKVLTGILRELNPDMHVSSRGYSIPEYFNMIWDTLNKQGLSMILVLDKIDLMKKPDILYEFSRVAEGGHLKDNRFVSVVGMLKNVRFTHFLDPAILSSFGSLSMITPSYTKEQLTEILEDRRVAFHEGVLEEPVIPMCAAYSAEATGNAREAIDILRCAGEIAEKQGEDTVTQEHVLLAVEEYECDFPSFSGTVDA